MATPTYTSLQTPEDNLRSLIASQEDGGATAAKPNGAEPISVLQAKAAFNADQKADEAAGSLEEKADLIDGKLDPAQVPDVIDARLQVLTGTDAALATEVLLSGEIAAPTDATGLRKGDGVTAGGSLVGRLATPAEAAAGTATDRSVTPAGALVVGTLASGATDGSIQLGSGLRGSGSIAPDVLGAAAVDLQIGRSVPTQCASGSASVTIGSFSTASGNFSTAIGNGATASSLSGVAIGPSATASGNQGNIAIGQSAAATASSLNDACLAISLRDTSPAQATARSAIAIGTNMTSSGRGSVTMGGSGAAAVAASGDYSLAVGGAVTASALAAVSTGYRGIADRYGMASHASGYFAAQGDAQRVDFVARNKTTTNSAVTLFLDGSSSRLTIPSGKVLAATVNVSGVKSDGTAMAHYIRKVSIKNVGGTTTLVSESTVGTDDAAGTSLAITADDTNDALQIAVTGIASETWRWVAHVEGVEIAYGT